MIYALLFGSCVVFVELFQILRLPEHARALVADAREGMLALGRAGLSDEAKEAYMRAASASVLRATVLLALKLLIIGAVLYALYAAAVLAQPALESELARSLVSPRVIALLTLVAACYVLLRNAVLKQL